LVKQYYKVIVPSKGINLQEQISANWEWWGKKILMKNLSSQSKDQVVKVSL